MKMTMPDGSVVEGTPEEFQRMLRRVPQPEEFGAELVDRINDNVKANQRLLDRIAKRPPPAPTTPVFYDHTPECCIITARRGWWSVNPPRCTCGLIRYPDQGVTVTTTGRLDQ